ncbi:MAG TPA: 4Fe-4S binding protein [Thermoplasmata archaeon]|jgi:2-oxoisovalerate ferredoxin oxidoreductase delta subunit|nr:4Fe-4S binding protein [Thermoplasmata archaeon]HUU07733.1 4Fe-4S binding protein [Thermoplasmata archaeon]
MTKSYEDIPLTPISDTPSTVNLTGTWRAFRPVVDREKCRKCTICWKFCPDTAIILVDGVPEIDFDYCKGCGICANECPAKCIVMVKEDVE